MPRALLVIDVQNEYFTGGLPVSHPPGSLDNILAAMDAARAKEVPVVLIQHQASEDKAALFAPESPSWELHPQVASRPYDYLIHKSLPGSFYRTDLEPWLRSREVKTVTICGYMTHMCCDTTARQAFHRGFAVEFLSDATGTLDLDNQGGKVTAPELQRAVLATQAMRFSRVMTTAAWREML